MVLNHAPQGMLYTSRTISVKINNIEYLIAYNKQVVIPNIVYVISVKHPIPGLENGSFRFIWLSATSYTYLDSDVISDSEIALRNHIADTVLEDESREDWH